MNPFDSAQGRPWVRRLAIGLGCAGLVYGMVYADLVLRARHAYNEGEKYMRWSQHPEEKAAFFDARLADRTRDLDAQLAAGRLSKDEHDLKLELAHFERDEAVRESSLKYAYVWYQTAVELFNPPESRWVALSREKMKTAKDLWKQELREKKIPFEEYMLE